MNVRTSIIEGINSINDNIKNSIKEGIKELFKESWDWTLDVIGNIVDSLGLIGVMTTWILNMMSVPNAGRWCYTIFALYIVIKILIKSLSI